MSKSLAQYWNPLDEANAEDWTPIQGLAGSVEELTLSQDPETMEYTRLTRFAPGANTAEIGVKTHNYPEEIFVVSGRLFDRAVGKWLETGTYASRPAGEPHGPFETDVGCVVLEISFPQRLAEAEDEYED